ncbi:MAG: polysaccharide deacetylase [Ruminococcaceae bacterium]|nr:polysaccharide deacetylase [Oscillospiraceae bacterium]
MYYCTNCKKKFRQYRRKCPICGSPCRHNDNSTILLIVTIGVLFLILVGLIVFLVVNSGSGATEPSSTVTNPSTTQPTSAPTQPSSQPTQPTQPSTTPTSAPTQPSTTPTVPSGPTGIGMYTREELEALDNKSYGYGPGPNRDYLNFRPEYAVAEQKKYEKYGANFIAPDNGNIYLTFDCGYEYYTTDSSGNRVAVTQMILDTLKEKNVKAVFFVTMAYVKSEPETVRRMIDEGHAVGNHTNNHPVMPTLSIDKMEQEVMSLHNYVLENFGYKMTLFRPPTGEFSIRSLAVVQNLGYKNVHWSFAHADYTPENQPDVDASLKNVLNKAHSGAIYLLHAVSVTNATILGDAIDGFQAKGFNLELFQ